MGRATSTADVYAAFKSLPVEVVAGTGEKGFQDGPALQATFTEPTKPCADPRDGGLFIPDVSRLRKLTQDGQVITVAGSSTRGLKDGPVADAQFQSLKRCLVDAQGNVLLMDNGQNPVDHGSNHIRQLSADGKTVTTLLGTASRISQDGDKTQASFTVSLADFALGPAGQLYIMDSVFLKVFQDGKVRSINAHQENSGGQPRDGNLATEGELSISTWIALDKAGNMLLADEDSKQMRRLDTQGNLTTLYLGNGQAREKYGQYEYFHYFDVPTGVTFDPFRNKFYVASISQIYVMDLDGNRSFIAGNFPQSQSEKALFVIFDSKFCVGFDKNLYISDTNAHQIKRVLLPPP